MKGENGPMGPPVRSVGVCAPLSGRMYDVICAHVWVSCKELIFPANLCTK